MQEEILERHIEASLRRITELWHLSNEFPIPIQEKKLLVESLEEHNRSIEELQIMLEELRQQHDVSENTRLAVEAERQRYQDLFEFAPQAYLVTNAQAVILEANQAAANLLNLFQPYLVGKPLSVFLADQSRQDFWTQLTQLETHPGVSCWEGWLQPRHRESFPASFRVSAVRNSQNQLLGWRWLVEDISQQKQSRTALEQANHDLQKLVEGRTAELWQCNQQLREEITNRQTVEAALEASEERYRELREAFNQLISSANDSQPTLSVSEATVEALATQSMQAYRQQTERERLINIMQERIRSSLDLAEILNTTVAEVRQFLQADRVVVYRVQLSGEGVVLAESADAAWPSLLGVTLDTSLFRERVALYRQGNILVVPDTEQEALTTAINEYLQQNSVKASLTVPLLHGNQFWGLLATHQCTGPRQWQPWEVELLKQLATQVSIAIQQSELYQQVQQLNTNLERRVRERTARLQQELDYRAMLKRITEDVRDSLDESQILQVAVWELAVMLNLEGCDTAVYDDEHTTSTVTHEYTPGMPSAMGYRETIADFWEGYRQLLAGEHFQFCQLVPGIRGPVAVLACPIFDNQGVLGDLWLLKKQEEAFDEFEIQLVQMVANQCAIAIRQARLYQAAQAQVTELKTLHRLKDDFLDTVSHELRTPLANMKMAIQMLGVTLDPPHGLFAELNKPRTEQSRLARYFQILQNECEREIRLIDNLLDLRRLHANAQPLLLTSIQLHEWLPLIVEPFQERACTRQQILTLNIDSTISRIMCDSVNLGRILAELLNNACKFTPSGGLITVTAGGDSGKLQLSVCNSGVEIPAKELPQIFEKFYRIPSADFWKEGGTGLGLALVKKLVDYLGGTLSVNSAFGQTCFTIELPIPNFSGIARPQAASRKG